MRPWTALLLVTSACGGEPTTSAPDATLDDASDGAAAFLDGGGFPDAYVDVDPVILGDAGGPFLCGSCICDGRTDYCYDLSAGATITDAGATGDASVCGDASVAIWPKCQALPAPCVSQPSCKCLLANLPGYCTCSLDTSGAGLLWSCSLP